MHYHHNPCIIIIIHALYRSDHNPHEHQLSALHQVRSFKRKTNHYTIALPLRTVTLENRTRRVQHDWSMKLITRWHWCESFLQCLLDLNSGPSIHFCDIPVIEFLSTNFVLHSNGNQISKHLWLPKPLVVPSEKVLFEVLLRGFMTGQSVCALNTKFCSSFSVQNSWRFSTHHFCQRYSAKTETVSGFGSI